LVLEPLDIPENQFPDVIKTEPAPDLPSLMDEIMPFLRDQQTTKPVSVNYKNTVVNYYPKHQITTTRESQKKTTMMIEKAPEIISFTTPMDISKLELTSMTPVYKPTTEHFVGNFQTDTTTTIEAATQSTNDDTAGKLELEDLKGQPEYVTTISPPSTTSKLLIGLKPKPSKQTTTTESDSFLDEFLKGFFENNEGSTTTSTESTIPPKYSLKYSSKVRNPPISSTTMPSIEIIENREGEESETNSFSFDSVLDMLFNAENQETSTVRIANRPKNSTVKTVKKPTRKTKKPSTTTTQTQHKSADPTTTPTTTSKAEIIIPQTTTTTTLKPTIGAIDSSFVTDQETGFPKINILQQHSKKPTKSSEGFKGVVNKQPESVRKPIKTSNSISGILKLAGCNIYGRMYRVGKIIAELTNPCLECMCTESGVQCSKIVC